MRVSELAGALFILGSVSAAPAVAADPVTQGSVPVAGQPAPKPEKMICKREARSVGSHFSRATCMTRSQWKAREQNNYEDKSRLLDKYNGNPQGAILPGTPTSPGG